MLIPGIEFRYINYCCYEIVLPNGKEIVIDPCIDFKGESNFKKEDFRGADYILLSHTHYDHTMDLGYLADKFISKVFVGAMSCPALLEYFDINFDQVYPVIPGEVFEMEDFTLEVFRSKHTFMNDTNNVMSKRMAKQWADFPEGHKRADVFGSIEYMDYLITTKENIRIFISGGGPNKYFYHNIEQVMKEKNPNIIFRQTSSKYTPEEFAHVVNSFHPQLVLPLHQDGIERKTNKSANEWVEDANLELKRMNSTTRILCPEKYKWYSLDMNIDLK